MNMRYDTDHKERTRQQILTEAAMAIRSKGPDRVGVAEVMGRLGLTHGGFYAHFDSKDDLIAEAITFMFDQTHARFVRKTEGREPAVGLERFIDDYLSVLHRDSPSSGCALAALSSDLPRLPEYARHRFMDGMNRLKRALAGQLRKVDPTNTDETASSVLSELAGALALARAVTDATSEDILRASRNSVKARLGIGSSPHGSPPHDARDRLR